ncbi:type III pantothenate kinase [Mycoplasma sp. OR1901]|uniref:type III pantothenate kinase n=1 Tax=Mycoplasma sp. OR1901 TaxID=2742195 RepID=UPI001583D4CE|nr:type III pantothenate kinase [Mycoplasma sp. OR1901]QKT05720.1 type III pantothenate kinase [Mycoplasma sp. OR1901]
MVNFLNKHNKKRYLVFDIGNSSIKYALYNSSKKLLRYNFQLVSDVENTLALVQVIKQFLKEAIDLEQNLEVILGSVNDKMYFYFVKTLSEYYPNIKPYIIHRSQKFNTDFSNVDINELGIDLIGLCESNDSPNSVTISFGTALTTVIKQNNKLISVAIAPGFYESCLHLFKKIKKLDRKLIEPNLLNDSGTDTPSALNLGFKATVFGYIQYFLEKYPIENYSYTITGNDQIIKQINIKDINWIKTEVMDGYLKIFLNNKFNNI